MGFRKVGFYAYYYFKGSFGQCQVPGFNADGSYCRMCRWYFPSLSTALSNTPSSASFKLLIFSVAIHSRIQGDTAHLKDFASQTFLNRSIAWSIIMPLPGDKFRRKCIISGFRQDASDKICLYIFSAFSRSPDLWEAIAKERRSDGNTFIKFSYLFKI